MGFVRKVLIALTSLIWLIGAVFVGLAGYIMVQDMKFKGFTGNKVLDIVILGLACFIFVVGLIGCLGVTLQKRCFLKMFFVLLLIFLFIQVGIVVVYIIQKSQIQNLWKANWSEMDDVGRIVIQKELKCCGLSASSVNNQASYNDTSCFTSADLTKRRQPCFSMLKKWVDDNIVILAVCGGLIALLEIVVMIITCLYIREVGRQTTVVPLKLHPTHPSYRSSQPHGGHPPRQQQQQQQQRAPMPMTDAYYDDDDYPIPMEHTRRDWAKQNHRQDWRNEMRGKR